MRRYDSQATHKTKRNNTFVQDRTLKVFEVNFPVQLPVGIVENLPDMPVLPVVAVPEHVDVVRVQVGMVVHTHANDEQDGDDQKIYEVLQLQHVFVLINA